MTKRICADELEAALAASEPRPIERKGICDYCKKPVEVHANEAWHTKSDKVWHEICSYQQQIEQLTAQLAEPRQAARQRGRDKVLVASNIIKEHWSRLHWLDNAEKGNEIRKLLRPLFEAAEHK